jgi:hypothetical protein
MKSKNGRRDSKSYKSGNSSRNAIAGPLTGTMERSREVVLNSLKTLQHEAIRLVDRRFERNNELLRECQSCRNLVDLMALQQRWLTGVSLDYYQGGMRLGRVMQEILAEEAMELSEAAESTMEQVAQQQEHAMQ